MLLPFVTRKTDPVSLISDEVIKEYLGFDPDLDLSQDLAIQVLKRAVIEQGEQYTGIVWAEADYCMESIPLLGIAAFMPISPVFAISEVTHVAANGVETTIPEEARRYVPASPEQYHPWGVMYPAGEPFLPGSFTVTGKAGWTEQTFPESLRMWALVRMATLYEQRQDISLGNAASHSMPRDHTMSLLDRWRVYGSPYA